MCRADASACADAAAGSSSGACPGASAGSSSGACPGACAGTDACFGAGASAGSGACSGAGDTHHEIDNACYEPMSPFLKCRFWCTQNRRGDVERYDKKDIELRN